MQRYSKYWMNYEVKTANPSNSRTSISVVTSTTSSKSADTLAEAESADLTSKGKYFRIWDRIQLTSIGVSFRGWRQALKNVPVEKINRGQCICLRCTIESSQIQPRTLTQKLGNAFGLASYCIWHIQIEE